MKDYQFTTDVAQITQSLSNAKWLVLARHSVMDHNFMWSDDSAAQFAERVNALCKPFLLNQREMGPIVFDYGNTKLLIVTHGAIRICIFAPMPPHQLDEIADRAHDLIKKHESLIYFHSGMQALRAPDQEIPDSQSAPSEPGAEESAIPMTADKDSAVLSVAQAAAVNTSSDTDSPNQQALKLPEQVTRTTPTDHLKTHPKEQLSSTKKLAIAASIICALGLLGWYISGNPKSSAEIVTNSNNTPLEQKQSTPTGVTTALAQNVTQELPTPWQQTKFRAQDLKGTVKYDDGSYKITGFGNLGNPADGGYYIYQTLHGDGSIKARVSDLGIPVFSTRAGVQIRDNLAADCKSVSLIITDLLQCRMIYRAMERTPPTTIMATKKALPTQGWVSLERKGSLITAKYSEDGIDWVTVGQETIELGESALIGLVAASGVKDVSTTCTFMDVVVQP